MKDIEITEEMIEAGVNSLNKVLGYSEFNKKSNAIPDCYKVMRALEPSPWKKVKELVVDESKESETFINRFIIQGKYNYSIMTIKKDMFVYFESGREDLAEFIIENTDDEFMPIPE